MAEDSVTRRKTARATLLGPLPLPELCTLNKRGFTVTHKKKKKKRRRRRRRRKTQLKTKQRV